MAWLREIAWPFDTAVLEMLNRLSTSIARSSVLASPSSSAATRTPWAIRSPGIR
jgi:hypothetical protein